MDKKEEHTPDEEKKPEKVDLSQLQNLDFGPNWTQHRPSSAASKSRGEGAKSGQRGFAARQDRRPPRRSFPDSDRSRGPRREAQPFVPTVDVQFLPEEAGFAAMCQAMRHSCRTYELFEIARLILAKPERYVVLIKCVPGSADGSVPTLHVSVPDGIPFEREDEAVGHVMNVHLESFFDTDVVEVDPPKGNFQYVSRCSMTGELLAPPNYHRYAQILSQHHVSRLPDVPFERFKSAIETVRDEETVNAWLESMKKRTRYTFKEEVEGVRPEFDSASEAQAFLLKNYRDRVVREAKNARFSGSSVENLPNGNIRRSIEAMIEKQRRFPLDTANGLRGRLRRQRFHIYKKGSHGVSYVCTVRRTFRRPDQVFSESVQELIRFLEDNPLIPASQLPEKYLGIKTSEGNPEGERKDDAGADGTAPATPDDPRLKKMIVDLRWLLTEGYVTEYSDGKLFVQPAAKPKEDERARRGEAGEPGRQSEQAFMPSESEEGSSPDPGSDSPAEGWTDDSQSAAEDSSGEDHSPAPSETGEDDTVSAVERNEENPERRHPDQG